MGACSSKDGISETQKKKPEEKVLEAPKTNDKPADAAPAEAEAGTGGDAQDPKRANSSDSIEPAAVQEAPAGEGEEPRPSTAPVVDGQAVGEESGKALEI